MAPNVNRRVTICIVTSISIHYNAFFYFNFSSMFSKFRHNHFTIVLVAFVCHLAPCNPRTTCHLQLTRTNQDRTCRGKHHRRTSMRKRANMRKQAAFHAFQSHAQTRKTIKTRLHMRRPAGKSCKFLANLDF